MTQLSPHFSLEELTHTDTGLPNHPITDAEMDNLRRTAAGMEDVRAFLKHPIIVDSGYRSPAVNMAVRGVATSAHCQGYAVDFTCPEFGNPTEVAFALANSGIKFDQLIREHGWVHISFDQKMRQQCLTKSSKDEPYKSGIS